LGGLRGYFQEREARCQWLKPIILATWEAEIKGIVVQKVKSPSQQKKAGPSGAYLSSQLRWDAVQARLNKKQDPTSKNNQS
jgi:hypothetical protein